MTDLAARLLLAKRRIGELLEDATAWPAPEDLAPQLDVAEDRRSFEVRVTFSDASRGHDLGLRLGEIVHHLRSVLDNAVFAAATQRSGGSPARPNRLRFPIYDDEKSYEREVGACLGEALTDLEPTVRAFQPFGASRGVGYLQPGPGLRDQHPLTLLQLLSNTDKHRLWTVVPLFTESFLLGTDQNPTTIEFDTDAPDVKEMAFTVNPDPIQSGMTVVKFESPARIKAIDLAGALTISSAVPSPRGPLAPGVLLPSMLLFSSLLAFRMDDVTSPVDDVWTRIGELLG